MNHDDYYTQRRVELNARRDEVRYAAYEIANTIAGGICGGILLAGVFLLVTVMV